LTIVATEAEFISQPLTLLLEPFLLQFFSTLVAASNIFQRCSFTKFRMRFLYALSQLHAVPCSSLYFEIAPASYLSLVTE